ncbi:MAG: hypothetical protein FWD36_02345 [Treponema sp.]|nr:hypothetical protein [Treponema sp.]
MNDFIPALKDRAVFLGWVAGLVLLASLLWSFSFPARAAGLMRVTNKALVAMDDERRLSAPLLHRSTGQILGCWYSVHESDSLFFVFTIMREGILVPCGAEVSGKGEVVDIIPLGNHAKQALDRIPQNLIQIYVRRIETAGGKIHR